MSSARHPLIDSRRRGLISLRLFVVWLATSLGAANPVDAAQSEAINQTSAIPPSSTQSTTPADSSVGGAPVRATPKLSFLLPAEGDVIYAPRTKVVVSVTGPMPEGLLAVLDGVWLDQPVQTAQGALTLDLADLKEGVHAVRLMYLDENNRIRSTPTTKFFVRLPEPPPPPPPPKLKQFGRMAARVEWKNEEAASRVRSQAELEGLQTVPETDSTYEYDTLLVGQAEEVPRHVNMTVEGAYSVRYERWEADVKATVSSQENRFRQPVNRFSAQASYGPWAQLKVGDVYPEYNALIFNGVRVRGAEAGGAVVLSESDQRWFYARLVSGEIQRSVPAYIIRSRYGGIDDTAYVPATRAQNLTAIRMGSGGGDAFDVGLTVMKSSSVQEDSIEEAVNDYLYGSTPSENFVTGLDARLGFWDGKVEIFGRSAISLYTRDRSLGAFNADTAASSFDPSRYRRILVVNPTTNGWEYLVSDSTTKADYSGFIKSTSALTTGISTSIPTEFAVWETSLRFDHLGGNYRSEGNPFLGVNPGHGWTIQQGVGLWDNRVYIGAEAVRYELDFGDHRQVDHTARAEVKAATLEGRSAAWINGGMSRQTPLGSADFRYEQDFDEVNAGGSHQLVQAAGVWNLFMQYGLTRAHFRVLDPAPEDPVYPVSITHAVTSSVLFNFHNSTFIPKATHTFADNGVSKPTHSLGLGAQQSFVEKKVRVDGNLQFSEYAKTLTRNGFSFGQNLSATLRFRERETWRLSERASWQGDRVSMIASTHYERSF